jgi:predicted esterase
MPNRLLHPTIDTRTLIDLSLRGRTLMNLRYRSLLPLSCVAIVLAAADSTVCGQKFTPPPSKKPDEKTTRAIEEKKSRLEKAITSLSRQRVPDPWLADIEVFYQAVQKIVQLDEFFQTEFTAWTFEALDRGLLRAGFAAQAQHPWDDARGYPVIRAYRSRVDGSVQPYAVTLPGEYGKDPLRKWRLDVVLHGRDNSLNEIKFLHRFNGDQAAPKERDFIQLDLFGRGNNAYRWAGETDVIEAIEHFLAVERLLGRERFIDPDRFVLRGFSMGGAGAWHLGLHRPDRWCVIGPGAGFTSTHDYVKSLPAKLPPQQEACLHIYDARDYAENATNVPIVAYSGGKDPQKLAADNMESLLKKLGISMTHLVAPELGHQFPPEWQKKAEVHYAKHAAKGKSDYPVKIHFVTYSLRYPSCYWVELLGLQRHFEQAEVRAAQTETGFNIQTRNVRILHLTLPVGGAPMATIEIDKQTITARPWINPTGIPNIYLENRQGKWEAVLPQRLITKTARRLQKLQKLQGPIDDAFMDSFLCVKGSDEAWNKSAQDYADRELERFRTEWSKYWRGALPVKTDAEVTDDDIANKHLILFGDPGSNTLIAQALDGLPVNWTRDEIRMGGKQYKSSEHIPVLIYPSPFNAQRYVVLNTGHTFHKADYEGTNALLFPRLGDYAIMRLGQNTEPVVTGLFDDYWRIDK